ncbi:hypothetical protein [Clostridium sp. MD294]|uniref:hypothetical protein n=1 Tax=Clostridium sp. MD294 TaxID=97138 RepID=UPI0002CCBFCE|nr:hypothetical protein [Clostridium sp. MD294]NDO45659.1 hypothetical protein [Clostridium sp. MD294]USF30685.1 hypothetical protein C820_002128 [Clostridium sp. MD294]
MIAISNNAAISANYRLTQFSYANTMNTKYVSNGSGNCGGVLNTTSIFASNNDYTKKDAIMKQWNLKGSFNIYEEVSVDKLQHPDPSDEVLQQFEKELQTNGIQKDINWSSLSFDFMGIGFDANKPAYTIKEDDFNRKVDYLASRYAAVEYKIKNTTSGDVQQQQLEKLQQVYQKAADSIAEGYAGIVGSYLEQKGISGETEKIRTSVLSGIKTKIEQYREVLTEDTTSTTLKQIENTEDKWLLDDDAYIASILRQNSADSTTTASQKENSPQYTLKDLEALGQYVSSLSDIEKPSNMESNVFKMDEAHIGFDFAMLAMKTDILLKEDMLSDAMSKTIQKVMNNFMNDFLDSMDKNLSEKRKENAVEGDNIGFSALNRDVVWDVYNQTMQHYHQSDDILQAMIKGAEYGAEKASSQSIYGAYRYKNNASYWLNFFEKDTTNSYLNGYKDTDTTFQKYFAGLVDFEKSLVNEKAIHMNMSLQSVEHYTTTKGNLFTKNA